MYGRKQGAMAWNLRHLVHNHSSRLYKKWNWAKETHWSSYFWGSNSHRKWVRFLTQILLGFRTILATSFRYPNQSVSWSPQRHPYRSFIMSHWRVRPSSMKYREFAPDCKFGYFPLSRGRSPGVESVRWDFRRTLLALQPDPSRHLQPLQNIRSPS